MPGVEIKAICNNHNIEVLGYGIDPNKIKIYKCDNLQELMLEHFKQIANKYGIKYDKNLKIGKENIRKWASFTFAENILKNKENIDKLEKLGEKELTEANFCRKCETNEKSIFYFLIHVVGISVRSRG